MPRVAVVHGTAAPPGRLARAGGVLAATLAAGGADVVPLDLAAVSLDACDGRALDAYGEATRAAVAAIEGVDAVVLLAPVYRASFPGVLKNLLDLLPVAALLAKPVGIVAMGGSPHHFLGVDWSLRAVLTWFGAHALPTSVYLTPQDFPDGEVGDGARAELAALADQLAALAAARGTLPDGPTPLAARWT